MASSVDAGSSGTSTRPRRTQQQRREHTRTLLLDATIDCLVELGHARTSVNEICKRAGVSRGAQQHHFTTKAELLAGAVRHLVGKLHRDVLDTMTAATTVPERIEQAIDSLWHAYSGTLSAAALELWVAARTDPELRAAMLPVDRAVGRAAFELYRSTAGAELPQQDSERLFWLTINLTRGLALDAEIGGDERRRNELLAEWKRIAVRQYQT
ncbi:TetR family transcriptional regulator [Tamaricihabitans halophyticus]|uniref:TetR family transcriptional regulator n=1 Tax=Tamaricihabitans halophyticus TaxID=1262583 RepID=A0A4R2QH68_9PSEU|nr:TetR family transcriptional regulator [Tamaricihabitans halophyticus]TCP47924.1 TetR family transcriptional regulator [Tamaricihabitans halophyticus]